MGIGWAPTISDMEMSQAHREKALRLLKGPTGVWGNTAKAKSDAASYNDAYAQEDATQAERDKAFWGAEGQAKSGMMAQGIQSAAEPAVQALKNFGAMGAADITGKARVDSADVTGQYGLEGNKARAVATVDAARLGAGATLGAAETAANSRLLGIDKTNAGNLAVAGVNQGGQTDRQKLINENAQKLATLNNEAAALRNDKTVAGQQRVAEIAAEQRRLQAEGVALSTNAATYGRAIASPNAIDADMMGALSNMVLPKSQPKIGEEAIVQGQAAVWGTNDGGQTYGWMPKYNKTVVK